MSIFADDCRGTTWKSVMNDVCRGVVTGDRLVTAEPKQCPKRMPEHMAKVDAVDENSNT